MVSSFPPINDDNDLSTFFVDPATGKVIWENKKLFKKKAALQFPIQPEKKLSRLGIGGNQIPLVLSDGNFLEFMSEAGLRKINAKTGEAIWTSTFKFKSRTRAS